LRANEDNHHELVVTGAGSDRRVQLWTRILGTSTLVAERAAASGAIVLAIEAFADHYELSFADERGQQPLGSAPTAPLSSESAGGFTGVYIGMFATTAQAGAMPPADFDWFEYAPLPTESQPGTA